MNRNIISKNSDKVKKFDWGNLPIIILCIIGILIAIASYIALHPEEDDPLPELHSEPIQETVNEEVVIEQKAEPHIILSDDDLMAMVVMAEAGNQDMLGKTAVAAVILNRCDYLGLTVECVVSAPNQFSYPYTGEVTEDCYRAVEIAKENRDLFPKTMMYFRNKRYHSFGVPYQQIGDHYFSLKEVTEE